MCLHHEPDELEHSLQRTLVVGLEPVARQPARGCVGRGRGQQALAHVAGRPGFVHVVPALGDVLQAATHGLRHGCGPELQLVGLSIHLPGLGVLELAQGLGPGPAGCEEGPRPQAVVERDHVQHDTHHVGPGHCLGRLEVHGLGFKVVRGHADASTSGSGLGRRPRPAGCGLLDSEAKGIIEVHQRVEARQLLGFHALEHDAGHGAQLEAVAGAAEGSGRTQDGSSDARGMVLQP